MKVRLLLIVVVGLAAWSSFDRDSRAGTLKLIQSIDQPLRFDLCQELAWDGQHLWTLTLRNNAFPGQELVVLHELEPSDGSTISWTEIGIANQRGLAWDGDSLWTTYDIGWGELDTGPDGVTRRSTDGSVISSIDVPRSPTAVLRGATWDGAYLWISDSRHREISQIDPLDGSLITSFASPSLEPRGLAWDGDSLWLVDGADGLIYQMDTSGNVLETWTSPAIDPYGITFDGEYLWVSDDAIVSNPPALDTKKIHQLAIPEPSTLGLLCSAILCLAFLKSRSRRR